jgi:hypothetical protein
MRHLGHKHLPSLLIAGVSVAAVLSSAAWSREMPIPPLSKMEVVGTLTCSLGGESKAWDANPAAQGRDVLCQFRPGDRGPEETYVGTVQGVGKASVLFARGAVMMSVRAAVAEASPGMLQQSYSADAAPKGAAVPLVGDRNRDIVLQPLHEEEGRVARGDRQLDAAIILIELRLKSSAA